MTPLTPADVQRNGFTENLGTDHVAVDARGRVRSRAGTKEAALQAAPEAVATFTGKDLDDSPARRAAEKHDANPALAAVKAQVDPKVMADYEAPDTEKEELKAELAEAKAEIAKMDPDGDGKVGGSKPKTQRKKVSK